MMASMCQKPHHSAALHEACPRWSMRCLTSTIIPMACSPLPVRQLRQFGIVLFKVRDLHTWKETVSPLRFHRLAR